MTAIQIISTVLILPLLLLLVRVYNHFNMLYHLNKYQNCLRYRKYKWHILPTFVEFNLDFGIDWVKINTIEDKDLATIEYHNQRLYNAYLLEAEYVDCVDTTVFFVLDGRNHYISLEDYVAKLEKFIDVLTSKYNKGKSDAKV